MTPKERLKRLESYSVCDNYREKEEDFREIEKALEVYEILKKHVYFSVKSRCIRMGDIYKRTTSFDYEDLKEMLHVKPAIERFLREHEDIRKENGHEF